MSHFQEEIINFNIIPVLIVLFMAALGGFFCCKALNGCHSEQSIQYSKKYGQSKEN
ncbi:transmembrane protein, putative (macronuclear) [Tetrahymena thermophila SB210]|uniref:Transmembrane protein, putative n=1 Tax=Tetrahymena thermophila (strain SB210) TaxID=312017 RepID=W7XAY2_TETTS|nr:transmembrane protein, putative [Tetrahymena thermophila SB210]EWS73583.1 transmembrane protein, putative [Tetrahymena thermophila SB210]|eukprot:XP_012653879.1 transmembrane protein, putative [Tetrahymena thermophila SB210]